MPKNIKLWSKIAIVTAIPLSVIVLLSFIFDFYVALRILCTLVFVLVMPGYWFINLFYKPKEMDLFERIILALVMSLIIVPLPLFYLNKIGLKLNLLNNVMVVLAINFVLAMSNLIKKIFLSSKIKKSTVPSEKI